MSVRKRWLLGSVVALLAVALTGCSGVVARVNGEDISREEFTAALEQAAGQQVLQELIFRELVYARAEAAGLIPKAEELSAELKKYKDEQFGGDETKYTQFLKQAGTDDTALLEEMKFRLTINKLRTANLKTDDATLKAFFDENRDRFDPPERVSFRQIVTDSREKAQQLIAKLNVEGTFFEQLVAEASMDEASKANEGLVSEAPTQQIQEQAKPLMDALRKLKPNQVTQSPVELKLPNGRSAFFILKLIALAPAETASWDDAKTRELVKGFYLETRAIPVQQLQQEVMQGANVVVLADRYKETVEPLFRLGQPNTQGLPPAVQEQIGRPPELSGPTRIPAGEMPQPTLPGDAGATGGN